MNGTMWSRVQTTGPTSTDVSPASSASSRRIASSGVSPGSMPPPGVAQNDPRRGTRSGRAGSGRPGRARWPALQVGSGALSSATASTMRRIAARGESPEEEGRCAASSERCSWERRSFWRSGAAARATTRPGRRPSSRPRHGRDTTTSTDRSTARRRRLDGRRRPTRRMTDTVTTDTGTTAIGLTAGCQKVADLSVQFGKALSAAGASGSTDLEKTAKAYESFAQQVPEEIRECLRDSGEGLRAVRRRVEGPPPRGGPGTRCVARSRSSPRRRSPSTAWS